MSETLVEVAANSPAPGARLPRVLTLWDLILYGIVAVTPLAPAIVFGLASVLSRGDLGS